MTSRELDRTLELADELAEMRARLQRVRHLEGELAREMEIQERIPDVIAAGRRHRAEVESVARALEVEWVDQGPLVSIWQRAAELAEQAEYAGADPTPYRADADEARRSVEAARLQTRGHLDRLAHERECLVDAALAAPIELPVAPAVRDDSRPEAARREALGLIEYAEMMETEGAEATARAGQVIEGIRRELEQLGGEASVEARIAELEQQLPGDIELPASAPPSAAMRLQRAGIAAHRRA
jgi:hypothetical protein